MDSNERQLLLAAPFLERLSPGERDRLAATATRREVAAGEILFHEGDEASTLYFLASGRVKLTQLSPEGREIVVRFLGPGEIFAGIAVLAGRAYPVTARAMADGRVLAWGRRVLDELAREIPGLVLATTQVIADHMEEVTGRFRELATERVAQRVARSVLRLAHQAGREVDGGLLIDMPLSRRDLAEMTGTTLYTVSRLLSEWEAEGLVEAGRERVVIRDRERLAALAEEG